MLRFKIDKNLPSEAGPIFVGAGYDAVSVLDQNLGGQPDPIVAAACKQEGRILVTLDVGFGDIRNYPPADYPGIIVLRLASQGKAHVLSVIRSLLSVFSKEPLAGKLWVVDESSIRIHA